MADPRRDDASEELARNQPQSGETSGGTRAGGVPSPSDMGASGGSSGSGGHGSARNQQLHPGQRDRADMDGLQRDQAEHQDRGQSAAAAESERD